MKVEIFSDVVCPWCAIGKRRFEAALARFSHADDVVVEWKAFELDPDASATPEGDLASRLARKYGMTREQALANQTRLTELAAADGLDFHFEAAQRGNTFDAHRLLAYAHEVGLQDALKERLFQAYFTEGEPISERATLARLGGEVGLDVEKCAEILDSGRFGEEVRADEREARELGVNGVPFFVIDRRFGISGAQPAEDILSVLEDAWTNAHPLVVSSPAGTQLCEGDACEL